MIVISNLFWEERKKKEQHSNINKGQFVTNKSHNAVSHGHMGLPFHRH